MNASPESLENEGTQPSSGQASQVNILKSLRHSLSKTSIGSRIISYHTSLRTDLRDAFGDGVPVRSQSPVERQNSRSTTQDSSINTTTGTGSIGTHIRRARGVSVSEIQRVLTSRISRSASTRSSTSARTARFSVAASSPGPRASLTSPTVFPPVLDISNDLSQPYPNPAETNSLDCATELNHDDFDPKRTREVREGKKREPSVVHVTDTKVSVAPPNEQASQRNVSSQENQDEWYGLDYALAMSLNERHVSEPWGHSAGEHSKSRESWAALHAGKIHPALEDQEYNRWQKWHQDLDDQAYKRRLHKVLAFEEISKERAQIYTDERRIRQWIECQKMTSVNPVIPKSVKEDLAVLCGHRPDPYSPPLTHGLAWMLKRSRSTTCIRELRRIPELA